jgi:hypothetical protein
VGTKPEISHPRGKANKRESYKDILACSLMFSVVSPPDVESMTPGSAAGSSILSGADPSPLWVISGLQSPAMSASRLRADTVHVVVNVG